MASTYLVALFCASAGRNGEDLGADEEQIVLFVYLLFDVTNNKVSSLCHLASFVYKLFFSRSCIRVNKKKRVNYGVAIADFFFTVDPSHVLTSLSSLIGIP